MHTLSIDISNKGIRGCGASGALCRFFHEDGGNMLIKLTESNPVGSEQPSEDEWVTTKTIGPMQLMAFVLPYNPIVIKGEDEALLLKFEAILKDYMFD